MRLCSGVNEAFPHHFVTVNGDCITKVCIINSKEHSTLSLINEGKILKNNFANNRGVVEIDLSETKTEIAKFFRDENRDWSRSRFWLRYRDQQNSGPRPRAEKWRHECFFFDY